MKLLRTVVAALALLALLVPTMGFGDQLPLPLEKKVPAGTNSVVYMGQTLRFSSPVALILKFDPVSTTRFRVTVSLYPGTPTLGDAPAQSGTLKIYWTDFGTDVYEGGLPTLDPWVGTLDTEGGFVDR